MRNYESVRTEALHMPGQALQNTVFTVLFVLAASAIVTDELLIQGGHGLVFGGSQRSDPYDRPFVLYTTGT